MRVLFLLLITTISIGAASQQISDRNNIKIRKYNKKKFAKDNYFYTYSNETGIGQPLSKLRIVKPSRSFWGSLREDGSIVLIKQDRLEKAKKGEVHFIEVAAIAVPHPTGILLNTAKQYYFPELLYTSWNIDSVFSTIDSLKMDVKKLSRIRYRDYRFVLQPLTVPIKFRKAQDTLTYNTETGVNIGFGVGLKWSYNWYSGNKSFLGQRTNQLSLTPGILFGIGATDIKAKVNAPSSFKDRKEPIFSYGGFFMVGLNSINIGFAIGKDKALKDGGKSGGWAYDGKTWKGFIIALDIIK